MELAANYAPQNHYCYVYDTKADDTFKRRLRSLTTCFPNVYVLDWKTFNMTSGGYDLNPAQYYCMENLLRYDWKYVLILEVRIILL